MATEKQEKWLTALQFAALAGRPGDQYYIKNKVRNGKIIKCPKFAEKRQGGKPTGLWPESYVLKWVAEMSGKEPRISEKQEIINRTIDNSLAKAFITGSFSPKRQKNSQFFKRLHARITRPKTQTAFIQEQL